MRSAAALSLPVSCGAALVALLAPALAAACPTCASREEAGSLRWIALGLLMISPWIVAGAIAFYIRRLALTERAESETLP